MEDVSLFSSSVTLYNTTISQFSPQTFLSSSDSIINWLHHIDNSTAIHTCSLAYTFAPFGSAHWHSIISLFHPFLYDVLFAVIKLITIFYLIIFARYQYYLHNQLSSSSSSSSSDHYDPYQQQQQQSNHCSTQSVLIFPIYLRIITFLAFLGLFQGIADVVLPLPSPHLAPTNSSNPFVFPIINSVAHAVSNGIEHALYEGVAFLLTHHGVGQYTTIKTLICGIIYAIISSCLILLTSAQFLSMFWQHFISVIYSIILCVYYLLLWLPSTTLIYRRPALFRYAMVLFFLQFINLIGKLLLLFDWHIGMCVLHFSPQGFCALILPYFIYLLLIRDSQYWQGVSDHMHMSDDDDENNDDDEHNYNGYSRFSSSEAANHQNDDSVSVALHGITFDAENARTVANQMDRNASQVTLISFASLSLEKNASKFGPRHTILGAGSNARVYRGFYNHQPVAIKTIVCMDLNQRAIQSFYREAALLTSLKHPNIVAVKGMCVNPPALCLVMELCGGTLLELLEIMYSKDHMHRSANQPLTTTAIPLGTSLSSIPHGFSYVSNYSSAVHREQHRQRVVSSSQRSFNPFKIILGWLIPSHFSPLSPQSEALLSSRSQSARCTCSPSSQPSQSSEQQQHQPHCPRYQAPFLLSRPAPSHDSATVAALREHNLPLLLDSNAIATSYDYKYAFNHPLDFWMDLLRSQYNPVQQELLRSVSHVSTGSNSLSRSHSISQHSPVHIDVDATAAIASSPVSTSPPPTQTVSPSSYSPHRDDDDESEFITAVLPHKSQQYSSIASQPVVTTTLSKPSPLYTNSSTSPPPPPPPSLPSDQSLSWLSRIELMLQCCTAVDYLHTQNPPILHLDIKSSNFLLGLDGKIKLADLELSRKITSNQSYTTDVSTATTTSLSPPTAMSGGPTSTLKNSPSHAFLNDLLTEIIVNGTNHLIPSTLGFKTQFSDDLAIPERVNWLAPELMLGQQSTEKADVYALSCVLWEIITGKVPFYDIEIQLKHMVSLPRGVSTYYHHGTAMHRNQAAAAAAAAATSSLSPSAQLAPPPQVISTKSRAIGMPLPPSSAHGPINGGSYRSLHSAQNIPPYSYQSNSSSLPPSSTFANPRLIQASQQLQQQQQSNENEIFTSNRGMGGKSSDHTYQLATPPRNATAGTPTSNVAHATTPTTGQIHDAIRILVAIYHHRPSIPIDTPPEIRSLIQQAWHPDPQARPTSHQMVQRLTRIKQALIRTQQSELIY